MSENGYQLICSASPTLHKMSLSNQDFDNLLSYDKPDYENMLEYLSGLFNIKKKNFKNIEVKIHNSKHPNIICELFSCMVGFYEGSFRCEYIGNGVVEIESE